MGNKKSKKVLCECGNVFEYSERDVYPVEETFDDIHLLFPRFQVICPKCGREHKLWFYEI